jgi:histidinol-phosphate aminotransferase
MSWVTKLARADIVALKAYEYAAHEPKATRLNANELPWRLAEDRSIHGLNRYPEPQSRVLIERLAELYRVPSDQVLVSRGSDEAIDLLIRAFCRAERDAVLICPPTFGMYAAAAAIQGAQLVAVPLLASAGFALDEAAVLGACTEGVKLVFLCSPNNPTGSLLDNEAVLRVARQLAGRALVVVDEAYIEFSSRESLSARIAEHPNLCVLRTLSKAHGLAGARCGTLLADAEVVRLLKKIIQPYAVSQLTIEAVLQLLESWQLPAMSQRISGISAERERMLRSLIELPGVVRVWSSAANFVLAQFADPDEALLRARAQKLLVRDVRGNPELPGALRVTIGTPEENSRLLEAWS